MVNNKDLEEFLKKIPPKPDVVRRTLDEVEKRDLNKAGKIAREDPVLMKYMRNLINKPIFGLRNKVTDIIQIFTILGTDAVYELLHHYLLSLLAPKKWSVFSINNENFRELQANLSFYWGKILEYENIKDRDISSSITLLPITIIVCDELFHDSKSELKIIGSSSIIDYDFLLYKLTDVHLKELSLKIGEYWDYPEKTLDIIRASSKQDKVTDSQTIRLGQWMHLLLFYVLSKPTFINSELNTFIKFDVDYIKPVYEDFEKALGEYF